MHVPSLATLKLDRSLKHTDSTIYLPSGPNGSIEQMLGESKAGEYSIDRSVRLECPGWADKQIGRVVACKCFRGAQWSVTIRCGDKPDAADIESAPAAIKKSAFAVSDKIHKDFFTTLSVICETLYEQISLGNEHRTGLIVVTGATASGKSEVTRGLIDIRMKDAVRRSNEIPTTIRKPHLITVEDPIEKFYVEGNEYEQPDVFDYTPREKRIDAPDTRSVLWDALRQTPTLVFVGEIRDPSEWRDVIDFASTGHSIIVTAHAGSLAEAWGKILKAVEAKNPAGRSDIADRVLGIVHLRSFANSGVNGSLPALWRYTLSGAKSLMADGRGSLVPLCDEPSRDQSSLGRTWFKSAVLKKMQARFEASPTDLLKEKIDALNENSKLDIAVRRSDLEGL